MASVAVEVRDDFTELRLGLPGGDKAAGKRGFEAIDLKLKLPTAGMEEAKDVADMAKSDLVKKGVNVLAGGSDPEKPPPPKAQAVGWPPVRSFRKNIMTVQAVKSKKEEEGDKSAAAAAAAVANSSNSSAFVKVSMDGAPYLRKVDLKMYKTYKELSIALENMFSNFTSGSEFVPTYEDKDGDWMLVGDVPWEMFVDSCKRLRIMKGSEAIGLGPRDKNKGTNEGLKCH